MNRNEPNKNFEGEDENRLRKSNPNIRYRGKIKVVRQEISKDRINSRKKMSLKINNDNEAELKVVGEIYKDRLTNDGNPLSGVELYKDAMGKLNKMKFD